MGSIGKLAGVILILLVALYSASVVAVDNGLLINSNIKQSELGAPRTLGSKPKLYISASLPIYTAVINDSIISGAVIIGNESVVLMKNVTFNESAKLIIRDDASVILKDFKTLINLAIYLFNSSRLDLYSGDLTHSSLRIYVYGSSEAYIHSAYDNIQISSYNSSHVLIEASITNSYIYSYGSSVVEINNAYVNGTDLYMYDDSMVYMNDTQDGGSMCYFRANEDAFLNISNSNLSASYIYLFGSTRLVSADTTYNSVYMFHSSSAHMRHVGISGLSSSSNKEFYVADSSIHILSTTISINDGTFNAGGQIVNSYVDYAYLYSAGITYLIDSSVDSLYYCYIHNGTLTVNQTDITSTSNYTNYVNVSSTISYSYGTSQIIARGASSVSLNNSYSNAYLIDVSLAYIFNATYVFAYSSNLYIENLRRSDFSIYAFNNTNISADNVSLNQIYVLLDNSYMDAYNLSIASTVDMSIYSSEMKIRDSTIIGYDLFISDSLAVFNNTLLSNIDRIRTVYSTVHFYESTLSSAYTYTTLEVPSGRVIFEDSNVSLRAQTEFILENGSFTMTNGVVVGNTDIVSGIIGLGTNNLTSFKNYLSLTLSEASLVFENYSPPYIYSPVYIELMGNSNLTLRNVTYRFDIDVIDLATIILNNVSTVSYLSGENVSIQAVNSELYNVDLTAISGAIHNTNIGDMSVIDINLEIDTCDVDSIEAYEGTLIINNSNVSSVSFGTLEYAILGEFPPSLNLFINSSTVEDVATMNRGGIRIEDSTIGNLYYALSNVNIKNSQLNFTLENFFINTTGDVVIDSNTIPLGKYESLLTVDGSTTIGYKAYAVVTNITGLNLTVRNSEYMGILGINAEFHVISSNIWVLMLLQAADISIENTIINSTFSEEPFPALLMGSSIRVVDTRIMGSGLFVVRSGNILVENMTSDYGMMILNSTVVKCDDMYSPGGGFWVLNTTFTLMNSNLTDGMIMISLANGSVENVTVYSVDTYNASVSMHNVHIRYISGENSNIVSVNATISRLRLEEGVNIEVWNSTITTIEAYMEYVYAYPVDYQVFPENIYLCVHSSDVNETYVHHSIYNASGTLEYSETLETPFDLKTRYEDTSFSNITAAVIDVYDFSIANITGFKNVSIGTLRIFGLIDESAPIIEVLNDTRIEYELGLTERLDFNIHDDTPREFWVLLDSTEILRSSYTTGENISVILSDIITAPGDYLMQINADDRFGNMAYVNISIKVYPAEAPTIVTSPPNIVNVTIGEEVVLSWTAEDKSPYIYEIYVDGNLNMSGTWLSGVAVEYSFMPSSVGTYNITIVFTDRLGQTASDTVTVNVKEKAPTFPPIIIAFFALIVAIIIAAVYILKRRKAE